MNKTHVDVLKNQIEEKRLKGEGTIKMSAEEYLLNKQLIDNQLGNITTS